MHRDSIPILVGLYYRAHHRRDVVYVICVIYVIYYYYVICIICIIYYYYLIGY